MAAQRQELATQQFNFTPTTLKEAQEYATIFASSGLCPEAYRGRPNDILIVWQMGNELGLDKMQSLRTLGCVNGVPFAYGDGKLALVKRHPEFEDMKEWYEGNLEDSTLIAFCMIKRKNQEPVVRSFSIQDAKTAGLWSKKGTWQQYPKRMLSHRARGYASNDSFPDALFGLMSEDEATNIPVKIIEEEKITSKGMNGLEQALGINNNDIIEGEIIEDIVPAKLDELKELITRMNKSKAYVTVTLRKYGIERLEDLTDEMIDKWIDHLKSKENKDAI